MTKLAEVPNILTIYPPFGARSPQEVAAMAKAKPGAYAFGSAGVGSSQHLAGELFRKMAGINVLHVPYKSGGVVRFAVAGAHACDNRQQAASGFFCRAAKRGYTRAIAG